MQHITICNMESQVTFGFLIIFFFPEINYVGNNNFFSTFFFISSSLVVVVVVVYVELNAVQK